jgi:hypothetical protein
MHPEPFWPWSLRNSLREILPEGRINMSLLFSFSFINRAMKFLKETTLVVFAWVIVWNTLLFCDDKSE